MDNAVRKTIREELAAPAVRRAGLMLMGILNVTPDSFSDGGEHYGLTNAIQHAEQMRLDGADIIDIGGESTRPGAEHVDAARRVAPCVRHDRVAGGLRRTASVD
jgi:dihydropteroate synthase